MFHPHEAASLQTLISIILHRVTT